MSNVCEFPISRVGRPIPRLTIKAVGSVPSADTIKSSSRRLFANDASQAPILKAEAAINKLRVSVDEYQRRGMIVGENHYDPRAAAMLSAIIEQYAKVNGKMAVLSVLLDEAALITTQIIAESFPRSGNYSGGDTA